LYHIIFSLSCFVSFVFFKAEDGIRDFHVTGVQTCALPISPGSPEPRFRGSLRCDWLAYSGGRVGQVRARFTTGRNEWLYGLGERFTDANRNGQEWDVRVYEEYKEQGKRTYLPIPFIVSQRGYGVWLDAAEPSRFDLRDTEAVVSLDRLVPEPGEHGEGGRSAVSAAAGHEPPRAANAGHQP